MHKGEDQVYAAFIGIDWADKKHDVCLQVAGSTKRERLVLEHRPGVIQAWAEQLRERFGGAHVAVSVELSRGPVVSALLEHDFFRLFPVLPSTVANYRKAFAPSGAKDDPTDAEVILELLVRHRDKLKPLQPESADMRALRRLVEWRRDLVQDRTRLTNRITDALKAYFPQVLEWFPDKEAAIFADFLERWPTLRHAQRARRETLEAFFRAGNVRSASSIDKRVKAIGEERPLHTDEAVIGPARLLVEALLPQLRVLSEGIERFEARIAELAPRQPDYQFFDDLPGAGPAFAPRLLVAFGENRDRFPTASSLQKSAGIAPVMERSGNKAWVHWRYGCSKFVRQTFVEWPRKPSRAPSGPRPFTNHSELAAPATKRRFAPSPSSGSASCTVAGSTASRTTNPATSWPSRSAAPPSSSTPIEPPDSTCGPPQGVSWAAQFFNRYTGRASRPPVTLGAGEGSDLRLTLALSTSAATASNNRERQAQN